MKRPKSLLQAKGKPKPKRVSIDENYIINSKYIGKEYEFEEGHQLTETEYGKALNWYSSMIDMAEARSYMEEFLADTAELAEFVTFPDKNVSLTTCWIARLISRGYVPPESAEPFFFRKFDEMRARTAADGHGAAEAATDAGPAARPRAAAERAADRLGDLIGNLEQVVDEGDADFSLYEFLKFDQFPPALARRVADYYGPLAAELEAATTTADEQLREGYACFKAAALRRKAALVRGLAEDAVRYATATRRVAKPRKKRPVSAERALKKLQYLREDKNLKLASVNPTNLIGAAELWTFNVKYSILTVFRASGADGLSVKGTTIVGYDEKSSESKRAGRKPSYFASSAATGAKGTLKRLMGEAGTKLKLQARINGNTLLLRAVR